MKEAGNFGPMMPGLDFMQQLMRSAGSAMPGLGAWAAPTLDPEELDKRIADLRTVQFWLEQNARMIGTTIQTLEVQRMTLSTLKNLNLSVGDLGEAFTFRKAAEAAATAPKGEQGQASERRAPGGKPDASPGGAAGPGLIDPVQWWTTLTQQFSEIAARTMRDSAAAAQAGAAADPTPGAAPAKAAAAPGATQPKAARPARRTKPRSAAPAGGGRATKGR